MQVDIILNLPSVSYVINHENGCHTHTQIHTNTHTHTKKDRDANYMKYTQVAKSCKNRISRL